MAKGQHHLITALEWHLEQGADDILEDFSIDRTAMPQRPQRDTENLPVTNFQSLDTSIPLMGTGEACIEASKIAASCSTLEELAIAIRSFEALAIKKTATQMVFADGNPKANIMLIGEAPGADEDRQGKPFVGVSGQLLDRILACIGLDRMSEDPAKAVYISNILNWRPPGNRTPSPAEVEISLPFISRHIALVQPKLIILSGGVSAKALLNNEESITKLRGKFHDIQIDGITIPAMATYHPSYLLRTPSQKAKVWSDMLIFQKKMLAMGLK